MIITNLVTSSMPLRVNDAYSIGEKFADAHQTKEFFSESIAEQKSKT